MAVVHARNAAIRQSHLNLQLAKAYLAGTDSGMMTRTWQDAFAAITETKHGSTQVRWRCAAKQKAFDLIRRLVILQTRPEHLLACLKVGTVSTNVHLRKLHNFCLAMGWLVQPTLPRRLWPAIRHQPQRAITREEHRRISEREQNPERRDFYKLCWHLGGSQGDIANLTADDIDWPNRTMAYPERFAQEALGHNSKAVHRAYARRAIVKLPSLESYEQKVAESRNHPAPCTNPEIL